VESAFLNKILLIFGFNALSTWIELHFISARGKQTVQVSPSVDTNCESEASGWPFCGTVRGGTCSRTPAVCGKLCRAEALLKAMWEAPEYESVMNHCLAYYRTPRNDWLDQDSILGPSDQEAGAPIGYVSYSWKLREHFCMQQLCQQVI
jgi:hypothetical protein